jgi:anti-sigma-K factor RskA
MSEGAGMNETGHERWREEVAAYVLGALDPERVAELERHTRGCERCQAEIRWLTPAVDALPQTVERIEPPRELRSRLLAEVRADARAAQDRAADGGPLQRVAAWLRGLGSGPMGLRPVVGFAAAVLVVVAVAGYAIGGGIGDGGDDGSSGTVVAGQAPGVTAKVVMEGSGAALHLHNVRQLPDERVLEAWVQRDGEVRPVRALFVPDREGRASTTITDMEGVETVMVTTEPPGGSKAPTSSPIVTIPIPQ